MARWVVCSKIALIVCYFMGAMAFTWIILPHQFQNIPKLLLSSYVITFAIQNSFTAMWLFNFYFIRLLASDLLNLTKELLQTSHFPGKQLSEFRQLWLSIWELSQQYAYSIAISVSFGLLLHSCVFITSCYGIISMVRTHESMENILPVLPYLLDSFSKVFAIIEIAHRAKAAMKDEFLKTMVLVDSDTIDHEGYEEVKLFTRTILEADPKITLYDFITVDRNLLISFLSSSVTYLIVLVQFRVTEEQSKINFNLTDVAPDI